MLKNIMGMFNETYSIGASRKLPSKMWAFSLLFDGQVVYGIYFVPSENL